MRRPMKAETLRNQAEIRELFRRGQRQRGRLMDVVVLRRPEGGLRALFVTSRKVGCAVVRNRVRRRLRAALQCIVGDLPGDCDVALVAFPRAARASYQELLGDMMARLTRAGLLSAEADQ